MCRRALFPLAAVLSVTLAAQQPPAAAPRSNDSTVTVDVRVVDEHGQFAPGLNGDDFLLFEDGVQQTLSSFDLVDIPDTADARAAGKTSSIDADSVSNDLTADQRIYILLLDDLRTEPSRSANVIAQAREFIEHRLTAADRAAVLTTSGWRDVLQALTSNRQRLLDAIGGFEGLGAAAHCDDPQACACSADRAAYRSMDGIARWLAPIRGQRKAVLLFSEGDVAGGRASEPVRDIVDPLDEGDRLIAPFSPGNPPPAACRSIAEERHDAADVAARANMTVYPVDPRQNADAEFARIVADTSSYYLLGYTPSNGKHDGTFRKIEVRTKRPGLTAATRTGYIALNDTAPKKVPRQPAHSPALNELAANPLAPSGLRMFVTAPAFRGKSGKASVEVIVDVAPKAPATAPAASKNRGKIELVEKVAGEDGRTRASERHTVDMKLTADSADETADRGLRVLSRFDIPPGKYVVRVAGTGRNDSSPASVQYDLDVPDFAKDPISMSGLALSLASEASQPTTGSDKEWQQRFDHAPTARRTFSAADELTVAGEAYINEKSPGAIEATTMVLRPSGEVAVQTRDLLDADGRSAAYQYESTVSLSGLEPGEYIFKVEVRSGASSASRQIPFAVAAGLTAPGVAYVTEPSLREVLKRAAAYVAEFSKKVTGLVAEETYEQDAGGRHRVLESDFLLVQLPGWAHPAEFRDVFEVDGQPVRDREERLTRLFLTPSQSKSRVEAIVAESARYNIGNITRTMNTPMLPLEFLAARVQRGFEFRRTTDTKPLRAEKSEPPGGPFAVPENAWVVEFREVEKETVIRNQQGRNIYSYGRFWIDPQSGRVLMSELRADGGGVATVVDVSYRWDDAVGVAVPVEMRESYTPIRPVPGGVRGVATYGNFRQFRVQTDEAVVPSENTK